MAEETARPARRAVAEWVLDQVYEDIFSGRLAAGDEVGEVELSERLSVSRSPIRDALRQLEFDGLVVEGARNGLRVVRAFGASDIADLYDVRASLEGLAFVRASVTRTEVDLQTLHQIQERSEKAEQDAIRDGLRNFDSDISFHMEVCRIAAMPRLTRAVNGLLRETRALLRQLDAAGAYPGTTTEVGAAHQDHRELVELLRLGDPDRARTVLVRHLEDRRNALLGALRTQQVAL